MLEVFARLYIKELKGNNSNVVECVFFLSFKVIAVHVELALLLLCQSHLRRWHQRSVSHLVKGSL